MESLKDTLSPTQRQAAKVALLRAIALAGTQVELAKRIGVTQQALSAWVRKDGLCSNRFVEAVEAATGVSRHLLRPDIYPVETPFAPPAFHGVDRGEARVSFQNGTVLQRNNGLEAVA